MPEQDNDDVDALLASIEQPSAERPMSAAEEPPAPETPAAPAWNAQEWEFEWNGKKVAPDSREKAMTWLSLGYNNSQRAAEFNKREASFKELEGKYKPYAEVDDYATKNPDWWAHVQEAFAKRGQAAPASPSQLPPEVQAALKPLQDELSTVKSFMDAQRAEQQKLEETRQDQALDTEIAAIRKQYPTIDLNSTDESGETLEFRVMKHAQEIGTSSFRAAFRDYLHDQLVESAKANGQVAKVKTAEHEKRQGILGKSSTPKKVADDAPVNVRGRSYDQITHDVLREYGIA